MNVNEYALGIWQNGTNDDVWDAIFRWRDDAPDDLTFEFPDAYPTGETPGLLDVAAELLERIEATPDFTVGDLTHEQVVAAILRRHPMLGPPPHL